MLEDVPPALHSRGEMRRQTEKVSWNMMFTQGGESRSVQTRLTGFGLQAVALFLPWHVLLG